MKTLKDLINDWLLTKEDEHTARIKHSCKKHDILCQQTLFRLEKCQIQAWSMDEDDKEHMYQKYDALIDKCNSELYWLDVFYDLNIGR